MSTIAPPTPHKPWYKQFWPWFLIALPSAAVIAGFITLDIAIRNADSPIQDDYSKQGFAIQHNAHADEVAAQKHLQATLVFDNDSHVVVALHGNLPEQPALLTLHCIHAFDAHRDITLALTRSSDGTYSAVMPEVAYGKWTVELRAPNAPWRLSGELDLRRNAQLQLPR